ncbi:hypothetical protein BSKO_05238 [Bryopsis sp. KO-2023]|nr:hypothetical protein BSKO_05238 [Bryopsis sp. KO-2023]
MNTKSIVADIVREKELRLREGMRILGLKDGPYWVSWAITHGLYFLAIAIILALVGWYPLGRSQPLLLGLFYFTAGLSLITYGFCISTLFSKAKIAGTLTLLIYVLSMVPGIVAPIADQHGGPSWNAACLLPPSAIVMFARVLDTWEYQADRGLNFETAAQSIHYEHHFSLASIFGIVLADVVIFAVLTWYLDKVIPKEFGQTFPPWFIFIPSYWRPDCSKTSLLETDISATENIGSGLLENQEENRAAVKISNLRKDFTLNDGTKRCAVDGLSLDIHNDTILALLGHNGAGKTTTINMLTGLTTPSGGGAFISGLSIRSQMSRIRNKIGLCPQFDILWPMLSVKQHLELYASIKGFVGVHKMAAAQQAANDVGLQEKFLDNAGTLSGGQRRKLSVAIAFMGEPEVVFLDEPTTGMDPSARRQTMDIIRSRKKDRAIIVTTHSMEEADALSDKIAIMAEGTLAAVGTSLELKSEYGEGYTLTFVLNSETSSQKNGNPVSSSTIGKTDASSLASPSVRRVVELVEGHVPSSKVLSSAGNEVSFRLPRGDARSFPDLLRKIEGRKKELGIVGYGLSVTTLEEVFLKINDQTYQGKAGVASMEQNSHREAASILSGKERNTGLKLFLQQFWGLFMKRVNTSRRERSVLLWQMVIPLLLVLTAVLVRQIDPTDKRSPLLLNRKTALDGKQPLFKTDGVLPSDEVNFSAFVSAWDEVPNTNPVESMEPLGENIRERWYQNEAIYDAVEFFEMPSMADIRDGVGNISIRLMFNNSAFHAYPAALNSFHNGLFQLLSGEGKIEVVNHPLPRIGYEKNIIKDIVIESLLTFLLILLLIIAMSVMAASFIMFIVREEESGSKQVQLVSGASVGAFWLAHSAMDFLIFLIPAAITIVLIAVMDLPMFSGERLAAVVFLFILFGFGFIPKTYAMSFAFSNEMKGLQRATTLYFLESVVGFIAVSILDVLALDEEAKHHARFVRSSKAVKIVLRIISPHFTFAQGLKDIANSYFNILEVCGKEVDIDIETDSGACSPWRWNIVGEPAAIIVAQCAAFWIIVFGLEEGPINRGFARLWRRLVRRNHEGGGGPPQDADDLVLEEIDRVAQGEVKAFNVGVQNISKTYQRGLFGRRPPIRAVENLSLGIAEGECFGLLGTNGAGKTTTFKMLTGQALPTNGEAFVSGFSTESELQHARRRTGYAPQMHGLPVLLTGREVLTLFARLRGAKSRDVSEMIGFLLDHLSLRKYADQTCGTYSGGNKRKLSVALAIIGNSPVVLLDEPSSGMDPGARRFLWEVIKSETTSVGHCVVLSSHSMEECEALCTRIGIMVDGQLKALGTQQQLKNRYGTGYILEVRTPQAGENNIKAAVHDACPSSSVMEEVDDRIRFKIPNEEVDVPKLFEIVEKAKLSGKVLDYSISQTKLEDVFLHLAQGANAFTVQID